MRLHGCGKARYLIKRLLALGVASLVLGAVVRVSTVPRPAIALAKADPTAPMGRPGSAPSSEGRPLWVALWTRATPDLTDLSLSPDGRTVAWVDGAGSVRHLAADTGASLFQTAAMPGVNGVAAAGEGRVLCFSRLNPADTTVRELGPEVWSPKHMVAHRMDGAIWTVAVDFRGDGAFIGTGQSRLVFLPLAPTATAAPAPLRSPVAPTIQMQLQGIPDSVDAGARNSNILIGTWQESGVSAWGSDGAPLWSHPLARPDRTFDVHLSADGSTAVAVSSRRPRGTDAMIHVWDGHTGRLIWSENLEASNGCALVSAHGETIAVSYERPAPDANATGTPERKVAVFDRDGHRLFSDMGGVFLSPRLVAVSPDGGRITVHDDRGYLWILDSRGRIHSRVPLSLDLMTSAPPTFLQTITTSDGKYLLVRRGDGQITLFKSS